MNLCNVNHSFNYELEKLCRIFLPFEKINILEYESPDEIYAVCSLNEAKNQATVTLTIGEKTYGCKRVVTESDEKALELSIASCLFNCFVKATGYTSPWGMLTGVRPVKLYSKLTKQLGQEETEKYFKEKLFVSEEKISLCRETLKPEEDIIVKSRPDSFSLYISIPFCPSRCSYCSFVSHSVEKAGRLIEDYVKLLCREIAITGRIAKENNLRLETVYIGGGTPTALEAYHLTQIMNAVSRNFDLTDVKEYTVEAGRPDVTTREKLVAIKNGGATRISINPQTMNDNVLEAIGRKHTAKQMVEVFNMARELGFDNINTDLIAGLPTDTLEGFKYSVEEILKLDPESVTVHSLSVKKAANISISGNLPELNEWDTATDMVRFAKSRLSKSGIKPYYMYRQSKTVGNLENVGYAKEGFEGLYNVYIMDETHTILACGASGVTKLREPNGDYIERIFNFKYPYEYISRFNEMISRKEQIGEFYDKYSAKDKQ